MRDLLSPDINVTNGITVGINIFVCYQRYLPLVRWYKYIRLLPTVFTVGTGVLLSVNHSPK